MYRVAGGSLKQAAAMSRKVAQGWAQPIRREVAGPSLAQRRSTSLFLAQNHYFCRSINWAPSGLVGTRFLCSTKDSGGPGPDPAGEHTPGPDPAGEHKPGPDPAGEHKPGPDPAGEHKPGPYPAGEHEPGPDPAGEDEPGPDPAGEDTSGGGGGGSSFEAYIIKLLKEILNLLGALQSTVDEFSSKYAKDSLRAPLISRAIDFVLGALAVTPFYIDARNNVAERLREARMKIDELIKAEQAKQGKKLYQHPTDIIDLALA